MDEAVGAPLGDGAGVVGGQADGLPAALGRCPVQRASLIQHPVQHPGHQQGAHEEEQRLLHRHLGQGAAGGRQHHDQGRHQGHDAQAVGLWRQDGRSRDSDDREVADERGVAGDGVGAGQRRDQRYRPGQRDFGAVSDHYGHHHRLPGPVDRRRPGFNGRDRFPDPLPAPSLHQGDGGHRAGEQREDEHRQHERPQRQRRNPLDGRRDGGGRSGAGPGCGGADEHDDPSAQLQRVRPSGGRQDATHQDYATRYPTRPSSAARRNRSTRVSAGRPTFRYFSRILAT